MCLSPVTQSSAWFLVNFKGVLIWLNQSIDECRRAGNLRPMSHPLRIPKSLCESVRAFGISRGLASTSGYEMFLKTNGKIQEC